MFDGASKGNPGRAGAGAVLLADDGRVVNVTLWAFYIFYLVYFIWL